MGNNRDPFYIYIYLPTMLNNIDCAAHSFYFGQYSHRLALSILLLVNNANI